MKATRTVWKYELDSSPYEVNVPEGAQVLRVGTQGTIVCVWMLVNPLLPAEQRRFHIFGTGHDIPKELNIEHVGGCQTNGSLEWHVFEEVP